MYIKVKHKKSLKEVNAILKTYLNIRITPEILGNRTFILIYYKTSKHPDGSDTLQYQSSICNMFS